MNILYKSLAERGRQWAEIIARRYPHARFWQWPEVPYPAAVEYLVAWDASAELIAGSAQSEGAVFGGRRCRSVRLCGAAVIATGGAHGGAGHRQRHGGVRHLCRAGAAPRHAAVSATAARTALDNGHLRGAVVDVTDPEPLPPAHPFWSHPALWLTPHIASQTQSDSAISALMDNLARFERDEPMVGVIDRQRGY